jgi:hypothetical protein
MRTIGMIVGEHSKKGDLDVNPVKEKVSTVFSLFGCKVKFITSHIFAQQRLSNVRSIEKEDFFRLYVISFCLIIF